MIKIEKDIPFPVHRESEYPWYKLKVGESFEYHGNIRAAQQIAIYYTRKTDKMFRARTLNGSVRVWRVE